MAHARVRFALLLQALALAWTLPAAAANPVPWDYSYAGYGSSNYANGIDGYDGYNNGNYNSIGVLGDSTTQHIANWIGVYQDPNNYPHPDWYQAGLYLGTIGGGSCPGAQCIVASSTRMYAEGDDHYDPQNYHVVDLGPITFGTEVGPARCATNTNCLT